jgi:hypothetical protein
MTEVLTVIQRRTRVTGGMRSGTGRNKRERREFEQKVTKKTKVRNLRGVLVLSQNGAGLNADTRYADTLCPRRTQTARPFWTRCADLK